MTVPTPSFEDLFLNNLTTWTNNGGSTFADDLHNPGAAFVGDGVDNFLENDIPLIGSSDGNKHTVSFWAKCPDASAAAQQELVCQRLPNGWEIGILGSSGLLFTNFFQSGNALQKTPATRVDNNTWRHFMSTIDGAAGDIQVYFDGVAQAGSTSGAYSGQIATTPNTTIGARDDGGQVAITGTCVSRIKIWNNAALTSAQAGEEFGNESAEIGPPEDFLRRNFILLGTAPR